MDHIGKLGSQVVESPRNDSELGSYERPYNYTENDSLADAEVAALTQTLDYAEI